MYFTPDWDAARESVRRLAELEPDIAVTGHGVPISGEGLRNGLRVLADRFDEIARPRKGRYVNDPAVTDLEGVVSVPPPVPDPVPKIIAGVAIAAAVGAMLSSRRSREDGSRVNMRTGRKIISPVPVIFLHGAEQK
jgi:hypothetical protein